MRTGHDGMGMADVERLILAGSPSLSALAAVRRAPVDRGAGRVPRAVVPAYAMTGSAEAPRIPVTMASAGAQPVSTGTRDPPRRTNSDG